MTSKLVDSIEPKIRAGALTIVGKLRQHGEEAYFAGGVVRDLLLERKISDIDIATSASPDQVQSLFETTVQVGKQYGVVVVVLDSINYEVATFRRESRYLDGRHPSQVSFAGRREDASRRDFTVNALFLNPFTGEIEDDVDGRTDLERRLIRTVGQPARRFEEDKLRILRAVRLACQLDFEIEAETWAQVKKCSDRLTQVSWERIRDELLKVLVGPDPARGLQLMLRSGILGVILPEVAAMQGVEQPPQFHPEGDVFVHTCLMFQLARQLDPSMALGVLLHDVGKPLTFTVRERIRFDGHAEVGARMADRICRRLKLSGTQIKEVVALVKHHLRFIHVQEMRESKLRRFLRMENFHKHLELHRLDCLASHKNLSTYEFCLHKLEEMSAEEMRPAPLLDGHDLIAIGLSPGPIFSEILKAIEDLQLEGRLQSRRQALEWIRSAYASRLD
ncbi:MAG: CCA tRNA nucleotidyltransferase [Acidobacteriota bacterium]